jgi:hypothetical protein
MKTLNVIFEDPMLQADKKLRRNVYDQMQQQQKTMQAQAMVSHERSCDIFDCPALNGKAAFCFKPQPDKVIE